MGLITGLLGLGGVARQVGAAAGGVAEVFVENRTARAAQDHAGFIASLNQFAGEAAVQRTGWFDRLVDALNRLPRPALALGTLALFVYAMLDPVQFSLRMQGLQLVPEPLWWLLGAVVSFYFGARELHHFRGAQLRVEPGAVARVMQDMAGLERVAPDAVEPGEGGSPAAVAGQTANAALDAWREGQR